MPAEITPKRPKKRRLGKVVKLVISILLIAAIYYTIDRRALVQTLSGLHLGTAVMLVLLYTAGQLLSALKWRIFVQEAGIVSKKRNIFRAYFFGMFINVFGFGTVGGDLARSLALQPKKGQRAAALATVVADRVHGLCMLSLIASVAVLVVWPKELGAFTALLFLGALSVVVLLGVLWWFGPQILTQLFPRGHSWGESVAGLVHAFPRSSSPLILASLISLVFHCLQISMHLIIASELQSGLSNGYLFATVPFVNIVSSLPISVMNGLGVREAMYILLFTPAGISRELAAAFGAVWLGTITLVSSVGILFSTPGLEADKLEEAEEEMEAEQKEARTVSASSAEDTQRERAWG